MARFVILPHEIHISHSMRTLIQKGTYEVTTNEVFCDVIRACAEPRMEMEGAWLGQEMMEAYTLLHDMGFAASLEVWQDEQHGGTMIDCQFETPHLRSMGGKHIGYEEYMEHIRS